MDLKIKHLDGSTKSTSNKLVILLADKTNTFGIPDIKSEEISDGMIQWVLLSKDKKEEVYKVSTKWDDKFTITFAKELCGTYSYYLQASYLSINKNKIDIEGVYISGYCDPKLQSILVSKTIINPGEDLKIDFNLEGLNANDLVLEVYSKENNELKKLYTSTGKCIEGKLSYSIDGNKTIKWKPTKQQDSLQLVVKLLDKNSKKYISHVNK